MDQPFLDNFGVQVGLVLGITIILSQALGSRVMIVTNAIKAAIPVDKMKQGTPLVIAFAVSGYIVLCVLVAVFAPLMILRIVAVGLLAVLLIAAEAAGAHEVSTAQRYRQQEQQRTGAKAYDTERLP